MKDFGIILMLIGLGMAWSGFSMQNKVNRFNEMVKRGILGPFPQEYGYHRIFRGYFWIPLGIGIILILLFGNNP